MHKARQLARTTAHCQRKRTLNTSISCDSGTPILAIAAAPTPFEPCSPKEGAEPPQQLVLRHLEGAVYPEAAVHALPEPTWKSPIPTLSRPRPHTPNLYQKGRCRLVPPRAAQQRPAPPSTTRLPVGPRSHREVPLLPFPVSESPRGAKLKWWISVY